MSARFPRSAETGKDGFQTILHRACRLITEVTMMGIMRPIIAVLSSCALVLQAADTPAPLRGYSADDSRTERQWEEKFLAIPTPDNLREYMRRLSARPHHVGSPYDKDNAEWLVSKPKSWGR